MTQAATTHPLRKWRKSAGKTIQWCADRIGVTRQTWAAWESGRQIPNRTFMPKVLGQTGGKLTANDFYQQDREAA